MMMTRGFGLLESAVGAVVLGCSASSTSAIASDTWIFTLNDKASTFHSDTAIAAELPGSLIGNWDADNNPTGTMTRPGATGGSGNHAIPYDSTLNAAGGFDSRPVGGGVFELDVVNEIIFMRGVSLDLVNDIQPVIEAILTITFNTFHTVQPNSIYFGNFPLDLPLGEVTVREMIAQQTQGDASGALLQVGEDQFDFDIVVPTMVVLTVEFNGDTVELDPFPLPLALTGTISTGDGEAQAIIEAQWNLDELNEGPFEGVGMDNVPVDVPTILPPGNTAHLLFSNELESVQLTSSGLLNAAADGVPAQEVDVSPNSFGRLRGLPVTGDLDSVLHSDDNRLATRPDVFRPTNVPPVQVLFTGTSPVHAPDRIELTFECSVTAKHILQRLRLYNFVTEEYELVDSRIAAQEDETVMVTVDSNARRFVHASSGEIRVLAQHIAVAFSIPPTWNAAIDFVRWRVTP